MSPVLPADVDIEMMDLADDQPSTASEGETAPSLSPFHTEFYAGAAQILEGKGETFMDIFNKDEHAGETRGKSILSLHDTGRMGTRFLSAQVGFEYGPNR